MRKLISVMLALVLTVLTPGAYAQAGYTVAGFDPEDTGRDWTTNLFFQRMEERTGVQLELTQYQAKEAWQTAKDDMLAVDLALPDALLKAELTPQETQTWLEQGKLIDLAPYLPQYAPNLWALLQAHPDWLEAVTLPGGQIAALPSIDELQFNNAMWINKAWLDKAKLAMPTTAEELENVLRVFQEKDMNGNGKQDEIPLTFASMWDLRYLGHAFGLCANDYYVTMDDQGRVSEVLTSDANRALLTWLNRLWTDGLLDELGFTGLRQVSLNREEDAPVIYGVLMAPSPVELVSSKALMQYVLLEPMVYQGKQVYRDLTGDVIRGAFAITSACKDPGALLAWVDTLYTEEGFILAEAGMEGEEYTWNEDGTWLWEATAETLTAVVLPEATIRSGGTMPGYASVDFQQRIDDQATQHVVKSLLQLKAIDRLPVPQVYLTAEQQSRMDALIWDIGKYAEQQMVWFVTGDVQLTDESWADFCGQVKALGMDELVSIWQTACDEQK